MSDQDMTSPVVEFMNRDYAQIRMDATVAEALEALRASPPASRIIYFYGIDAQGRLRGVVPTRRLLLAPPETPVAQILESKVIAIPHTSTVLEACEFFVLHRLLAFPVVDEEHRVLGTVDVELYTEGIDELEEVDRSDDLFQLIGIHLTEAKTLSPRAAFVERCPWLLCNVLGGVLAAVLASQFEAELQRVVAIALFIPVVLALAESVGIQSVSLSLLLLHRGRPSLRALWARTKHEAVTGALLGIATGALVGLVGWGWLRSLRVAACLGLGIAGGVACAAVIGMVLPYAMRLLDRDPKVAAGPIALVCADIVTLTLYFNIARAIL